MRKHNGDGNLATVQALQTKRNFQRPQQNLSSAPTASAKNHKRAAHARTNVESAKAKRLEREVAGLGAIIVDKQIERLFAQYVLLGEAVLGHHARNVCVAEKSRCQQSGGHVIRGVSVSKHCLPHIFSSKH